MTKLTHLITLIILFKIATAGFIIPDPQNPFIITTPNTNTSSNLTFNFKLPNNSKGLTYQQYIAVVFPKFEGTVNLGTQNFKFHTANQAKCALYQDSQTTIPTTWIQSPIEEENIAYCKITETSSINTPNLPLKGGISYRLVITITNYGSQKPSAIRYQEIK